MKPRYMRATEAADEADVVVQTIYRWIDKGKVKGVRIRGHRYVEVESFRRFLQPVPTVVR